MIILTYAAVGLNNILKKYRVSPSSPFILKEKSEGFPTKVRYNAWNEDFIFTFKAKITLRTGFISVKHLHI